MRGKKLVSFFIVLALLLIVTQGRANVAFMEEGKLKVAFIYVGPIGDLGWSWAHDQGRQKLEATLDYVETTYIESVAEADAERVMRDFVNKGYNIIFATSFGYMDAVITVASEYPKVIFEHCSGYKTAENAATYFGRIYQARYLSGLVAGKMTKANKIGYVAAYPIPEVIRGINAFTLGVREVNPEAEVHVVWTNTWYDPVLEKEAAEGLLDIGVDVLAQHQDTAEPQKAASERGVYGIGYDSDMSAYAPNTVLTSAIWDWGIYYINTVKAVKEGAWKTHEYWGGMEDGIVKLAPYGPMVPDEVKELVKEKEKMIVEGTWDVFTGPIKDQSGNIVIPEGEKATDEEMLSVMFFVEGVVGNIPK